MLRVWLLSKCMVKKVGCRFWEDSRALVSFLLVIPLYWRLKCSMQAE